MNLSAFFKAHKPEAIIGAAGAVAAIALYARSKKTAATSSGQSVAYPGASGLSPYSTGSYPLSTYDSTGIDLYNGLEGQIQQLQSQLPQPGAAGGTGPTYEPVSGFSTATQLLQEGVPEYFNAAPAGATPIYEPFGYTNASGQIVPYGSGQATGLPGAGPSGTIFVKSAA